MENIYIEEQEETLNWLTGYIEAIRENEVVKPKQIDIMTKRISQVLVLNNPLNKEFESDLPF